MKAENKRTILIFANWFEPAYKAGGPIRSCVNFAANMCDTFNVFVFTSNRDLGDKHELEGIVSDEWITSPLGVRLFYASSNTLNWKTIQRTIVKLSPDFIYLNSLFSRHFSLYPMIISRYKKISGKVILAPRGMLKESALKFKPLKKKIFLAIFKGLRFPQFLTFHSTDFEEERQIRKKFGKGIDLMTISNFSGSIQTFSEVTEKNVGYLRMVFVGRIHPIKNLHLVLQSLRESKHNILLTVVGVKENPDYLKTCELIIDSLPSNVTVKIVNEVPHYRLNAILLDHHLFVLPSQGENFGHAIFEALAAGRPVLISDQTPWRNLEQNMAGWDISLESPDALGEVICKVAAMSKVELNDWCLGAWKYCNEYMKRTDLKGQYLELFN